MSRELLRRADEAWRRGQWLLALTLYLDLLRKRLLRARDLTSGWALDNYQPIERTAYLAVLLGHAEEADLLLSGLTELCRRRGLSLDADRLALQRVQLALGDRDFSKAYELLDALRPTLGNIFDRATLDTTPRGMIRWEQERHHGYGSDRHAFFAQFYLNMGRLAEYQGDFGLAVITLERGLHHAHEELSVDAGNYAVPLHLELCEALIEAGDLRSAGAELALACPLIDGTREPGHAVREKELWAAIHMLTGEFASCLDQLRHIVTFLKRQGLLRPALTAQLNLAHSQIFLLQTEEARHSLEFVAEQARLLKDPDLEGRARQLALLADWYLDRCVRGPVPSVRLMQGDMSRSAGMESVPHPRAVAHSGSFLSRFEERAASLHTLLESGYIKAAEEELKDVSGIFGSSDSALVRTRLMTLQAETLAGRKEYERAWTILREVLPVLRALGLKPELSVALTLSASYAERAGRQTVGGSLIQESLELTDEMARSLAVPERLILLLGRSVVEEKWLKIKLDCLRSFAEGSGCANLWPEVSSILSRIEAHKELLYREILGESSGVASDSDQLSLSDCPTNRAVVRFAVISDRVFLVCYTRGDFRFRIRPVGRWQVRGLVAQWHVALRDSNGGFAELVEAGRNLAAALGLFEVLDKLPPEVSELIFIPDDSLHGFPFAALRDDKGYLIERYAISIGHRRPRPPARASAITHPLLAAVMCGARRYPVLSVVNELDWLAKRFTGSHQLAAEEVNPQSLLKRLQSTDLLHIVCHGTFSCEHPEQTGLVLIPYTGQPKLLSLIDIAGLTIPGLKHATLVACCGADNYILPGRWVLGISEVLCCCGTQSVLASLWETHSLVADRFVRAFYNNLSLASRNEALRRTQLEFLERGEPLVDWSGWQLYGETGPLSVGYEFVSHLP